VFLTKTCLSDACIGLFQVTHSRGDDITTSNTNKEYNRPDINALEREVINLMVEIWLLWLQPWKSFKNWLGKR
jgi:hypothetical protein